MNKVIEMLLAGAMGRGCTMAFDREGDSVYNPTLPYEQVKWNDQLDFKVGDMFRMMGEGCRADGNPGFMCVGKNVENKPIRTFLYFKEIGAAKGSIKTAIKNGHLNPSMVFKVTNVEKLEGDMKMYTIDVIF